MNTRVRSLVFVACTVLLPAIPSIAAVEPGETFYIWPDRTAPGDTRERGEERVLEGRPRPFYQLTDISEPTVTVFQPDQPNGNAVLVCPGGGFQRLAWEIEGLEMSAWLASRGVTAFALKYRVPISGEEAARDGQRAMGLIRSRAGEWGVDPDSLGVIGFSAGGEMAAWMAVQGNERLYERVDAADAFDCRPDFAALIYPGGLLQWRSNELKEDFASRLSTSMPPMFLAHAFDDSSLNSLAMATALKRTGVPTELHLFQAGGHGFGARDMGVPTGQWKNLFVEWLDLNGHMAPTAVRTYATAFAAGINSDEALSGLRATMPTADLDVAYVAQRRLVDLLRDGKEVGGFKGAAASKSAQEQMQLDGPLAGVLLPGGELKAGDRPKVSRPPHRELMVETEIGYRFAVDIATRIPTAQHARDAVAAMVPVIELPAGYGDRFKSTGVVDTVASNIGSHLFIVGEDVAPERAQPDAINIALKRNGETLHTATGNDAHHGQWEHLRRLVNQLIDQGHTIKAGTLVISGALGVIQPGEPGDYTATFDGLGEIRFSIE